MNYKDIVEKLFEEIKKEFDTAIYRKDWNYIQFPIESIFGTHIELWLVDAKNGPNRTVMSIQIGQ